MAHLNPSLRKQRREHINIDSHPRGKIFELGILGSFTQNSKAGVCRELTEKLTLSIPVSGSPKIVNENRGGQMHKKKATTKSLCDEGGNLNLGEE